jgi:hypothetical protein
MPAPQSRPVNFRREAFRRARRLYEQYQSGGEFLRADFDSALRDACRDLTEASYETAILAVAEQVDRDATNPRVKPWEEEQPDLPGFDLDGVYPLKGGRRIAKLLARREHIEEHLALSDANLIVVQGANLRDREEYLRLLPFLGPGVTKQRAVEAYRAASPDNR